MATQAYLSTVPPAVPNRARRALLRAALATFILALLASSWVGTEMNLLHLFIQEQQRPGCLCRQQFKCTAADGIKSRIRRYNHFAPAFPGS